MTTPAVPYRSDSEIEREATQLLAAYGREHGPVVEPPVPVDDLLELHLRLTFEIRDLRGELGVPEAHGAIWVRERRIAVDRHLDPDVYPAMRGRFRFTVAHEVGHWQLHRHHFAAPTPSVPDFVGLTRRGRAEFQADRFAAGLLMPLPLLRVAWEELFGCRAVFVGRVPPGRTRPGPADDELREFASPLAELFEVSPSAMRFRLAECGLVTRPRGVPA